MFLAYPVGSLWAQIAYDSPQSLEDGPDGDTKSLGSPYIELDSWIYPALERLAALAYIDEGFLGTRPWTRIGCALLVEEAGDKIRSNQSDSPEANDLYEALLKEFQPDLNASTGSGDRYIHLGSLYASATEIAGRPLNDSYHFGQTVINNYGRPYQQGFNSYDGFSGWAAAGRFVAYVRGEYQHAPSAPGYSLPVRQLIATIDRNPLQPLTPVPTANQFRFLDTYVAAKVAGWNLAFGKQSLWWGPAEGSALLFSNNAEPIYMFRVSRIVPFTLPWILRWLGPMKVDAFYGKLSGNDFPPRPLIHGEKISFKPTPNLELGFTRTAEFGGVGRPFTFERVWRSYFSVIGPEHRTPANDPGKRTGGFDVNYRVPFLRNWLTVYTDSLSDDDISPLCCPGRAGLNPGVYLARFPKIHKLDLRMEGVLTDTPNRGGPQFNYFDSFYHDLYTNKNNIIGSWIGRDGQGLQAWSTYWFRPRNSLQFGYRHAKVSKDFIPSGETLNDGSVKLSWWMRDDLSLSTFVQYEKWLAPILAPRAQTNWTSRMELCFEPRGWSLPLRPDRQGRGRAPVDSD